jgi:hypothetical protein
MIDGTTWQMWPSRPTQGAAGAARNLESRRRADWSRSVAQEWAAVKWTQAMSYCDTALALFA